MVRLCQNWELCQRCGEYPYNQRPRHENMFAFSGWNARNFVLLVGSSSRLFQISIPQKNESCIATEVVESGVLMQDCWMRRSKLKDNFVKGVVLTSQRGLEPWLISRSCLEREDFQDFDHRRGHRGRHQ